MADANHPNAELHAEGKDAAHVAHHFETPAQQFAAGKLGMWIFLVTEILFFGGLFCAYAVYRANHPEIFIYAHQFLDKYLGAINTAVLILSSLTMAWGVRCAQCDQRRGLILCLALTLACASVFLGIKYVEYEHKWKEGLLWAGWFDPGENLGEEEEGKTEKGEEGNVEGDEEGPGEGTAGGLSRVSQSENGTVPFGTLGQRPRHVGVFFSIYFALTGLHAVHVIAGMMAIAWILVRAAKGHFGSRYFGPVDLVGLYWHLVDMIWIFLFPLLYLIH